MRFPEALEAALDDLKPNMVADYAFNLAGAYNSFYAECQAWPGPHYFYKIPVECCVHVEFRGGARRICA